MRNNSQSSCDGSVGKLYPCQLGYGLVMLLAEQKISKNLNVRPVIKIKPDTG